MIYLLFALFAAVAEEGQGDIQCVGLRSEGECSLSFQVGDDYWDGTLYQAQYGENEDCETHLAVWFNHATATFRGEEWSAEAGNLCVPRVGSPWEWAGSVEWTTETQAYLMNIRILTIQVTREYFSGSSEVRIGFPEAIFSVSGQ